VDILKVHPPITAGIWEIQVGVGELSLSISLEAVRGEWFLAESVDRSEGWVHLVRSGGTLMTGWERGFYLSGRR
jgi:hypothetical protein